MGFGSAIGDIVRQQRQQQSNKQVNQQPNQTPKTSQEWEEIAKYAITGLQSSGDMLKSVPGRIPGMIGAIPEAIIGLPQGIASLPSAVAEDVGDVYNDLTGVTTAREIGAAQQEALENAKQATEQAYQQSVSHLSPYAAEGGAFLGPLAQGVASGQFVPGQFDYSGQQAGQFNYQGAGQQGDLNYQGAGQQGATGYQGGPEMGSISDFMGDPSQDPGYQFRLAEGQKAIDRAAAAGGRFGGGQTAKELMRFAQGTAAQGYADDFARAGQEREAQRFGEQDIYGRGLTALQLQNQAEQSGYGRDVGAFDRANLAEQSQFGRDTQGYEIERAREQEGYGRERTGYDYEADRIANRYGQYGDMVSLGERGAMGLSNAALGQGTNLSNIAIGQGNARAAQIGAEGTTLGNALGLGSSLVDLAGSAGDAWSAWNTPAPGGK